MAPLCPGIKIEIKYITNLNEFEIFLNVYILTLTTLLITTTFDDNKHTFLIATSIELSLVSRRSYQ